MGRRKRRRDGEPPRQLNPLKSKHNNCLSTLSSDWIKQSFRDTSKPFIIDLGCGEGEWLLNAARDCIDYNYLGLELRLDALLLSTRQHHCPEVVLNYDKEQDHSEVHDTNETESNRKVHSFENLGFIHANIIAGDLETILSDLDKQRCSVYIVCVQFPDPHWKGKHKKRRILTQSLLRSVWAHLMPNGLFYLQSDVREVVCDVRAMVSASDVPRQLERESTATQKSSSLRNDHSDISMAEGNESATDMCSGDGRCDEHRLAQRLCDLFHPPVCAEFRPEAPPSEEATHDKASASVSSDKGLQGVSTYSECTAKGTNGDVSSDTPVVPVFTSIDAIERHLELPSVFFKYETERCTYVKRKYKSIHHMVIHAISPDSKIA